MNTDATIIEQFIKDHPTEAAIALDSVDPDKLAAFFNNTLTELSVKLIPLMKPQLMSAVFESMQKEKVVELFESLEIHYTVLLLRIMKGNLGEEIILALSSDKSTTIKRLQKYLENSVGSHLDPSVFTLSENMTVKQALMEAKSKKIKLLPNIFVLTEERKLAGVVDLSELITGDPKIEIRNIMKPKLITLSPETPVKSILTHREWTDYYNLPVVDNKGLFMGVIGLETIRSIMLPSERRKEEFSLAAVSALGELFQIGLGGLLKSATDLKSISND